VRGNSKDGRLLVTVGEDSPITALEWKDGLVDQVGDLEVEIPDGGGGGGDMNLQIFTGEIINSGGDYEIINFATAAATPTSIHYFRNGRYVGTTDPEDLISPPVYSAWNWNESS